MSHFTKTGTKVTDMNALRNALSTMGLNLYDSAECRFYYGTSVKENVVKLPGKYDMYFEKSGDGSYEIVADLWGGEVNKTIGNNGSTLIKQYVIEKLKIETFKKGYSFYKISDNRYKIVDPLDETSGYLEAVLDSEGNFTFKANGFSGSKCMKFSSLEESMGDTSRTPTADFYKASTETLKEWN